MRWAIREILAEAPRKQLARSCGEDSRAVVAQYGWRLFSEQGGRRERDGPLRKDFWIHLYVLAIRLRESASWSWNEFWHEPAPSSGATDRPDDDAGTGLEGGDRFTVVGRHLQSLERRADAGRARQSRSSKSFPRSTTLPPRLFARNLACGWSQFGRLDVMISPATAIPAFASGNDVPPGSGRKLGLNGPGSTSRSISANNPPASYPAR